MLKVPPGFSVSVFASGLPGARLMALSPEGVVVLAKRAEVVALPDANGDGTAEPTVLADGLNYAHSVAFNGGYLYIGTTAAVLRAKWAAGAIAGPVDTYVTLPSSTPALHTSRSIAFGPDGRLYVGIGSSCNVCVEEDGRRTTIQVYDGPGSTGRTFAAGLHNAVGFDWDPVTGRMWSADTGQEQLGDDYPPDEINLIEDGRHYGFPFFHGKSVASTVPELASVARTLSAGDVVAPVFELPAHASPLGLTFYRGTAFPPAYRSSIYVAIHGSTQRSTKIGYAVARIVMQDGRPVESEDFVTGWLSGDAVSGRPAGVVTGADGALYISDDNKGFVYRVAAAQAATPASGATSRPLLTERLPALNGATLDARLVEVTLWARRHLNRASPSVPGRRLRARGRAAHAAGRTAGTHRARRRELLRIARRRARRVGQCQRHRTGALPRLLHLRPRDADQPAGAAAAALRPLDACYFSGMPRRRGQPATARDVPVSRGISGTSRPPRHPRPTGASSTPRPRRGSVDRRSTRATR